MSVAARLQRLRAEVKSDRQAAEQQFGELAAIELTSESPVGDLAHAAVALHHGYGAIEALLARVARTLGEGEPEGRDWHQGLLRAMSLEIEGVRPAVLSSESQRLLRRLLAFRHFFRHAYAVALDWDQLAQLRSDALAIRSHLARDLDALEDFLRALAEQAAD